MIKIKWEKRKTIYKSELVVLAIKSIKRRKCFLHSLNNQFFFSFSKIYAIYCAFVRFLSISCRDLKNPRSVLHSRIVTVSKFTVTSVMKT